MAVANSSRPSADIHVMPRNDLVLHEPSDDCVCRPEIEEETNTVMIGMTGEGFPITHYIAIHHALDGRE